MTARIIILSLTLLWSISATSSAEPQKNDGYDHSYDELIGPQKLPDLFEPEKHGMNIVASPQALYGLLTKDGRCPLKKAGKRGVPCAFISYAPPGTREDAYLNSLRPVFRVESESRIWTYLNSELALVRIADLQRVGDLSDENDPGHRVYEPTAVVGYEENQDRCAKSGGQSCVEPTRFLMFMANGALTPGCLDEIWSKRGPSDSGTQSRCRFAVPAD